MLEAFHPGSSLEEVKESTGFSIRISPSIKMTPLPTDQELFTLRTVVREKLKSIYREFAQKKIRPA
jgi:hypothetical protein